MAASFRDIAEYRLRQHTDTLAKAVMTTDPLVVPATAANVLDALYALTRYWRDQDQPQYDELCRSSDDGKIVGGLTYLRGHAIHRVAVSSDLTDHLAEYFYDHFGCWAWYADATLDRGDETAPMYTSHVAGRDVAITLPAVTQFALHTVPEALG